MNQVWQHHTVEDSLTAKPASRPVEPATFEPADLCFQHWVGPLSRPRARPRRWSSTLDPQDLACLLQVIEARVIPRLLRDYQPASQSRLKAP